MIIEFFGNKQDLESIDIRHSKNMIQNMVHTIAQIKIQLPYMKMKYT